MRKRTRRQGLDLLYKAAVALVVLGMWVFYLFPIFWLLISSFKPEVDLFAVPPRFVFSPTLKFYRQTFADPDFGRALRNSLLITVVTTALVVGFGSLASYAFARFRFRGSTVLSLSLLIIQMMPGIAFTVPLFLLVDRLHLRNTHLGLILVFTTFGLPFTTWILRSFLEEVPRELEEAAWIDGATRMQSFFRIMVPLAMPGLAVTTVFAAVGAWNAFLFAMLLGGPETYTLPVFLASHVMNRDILWGRVMATGVLVIFPPIFLAMLVQRNLVKGLTLGAIKG
jgi:multiple sugar transport system permease protein